MPNTPPEAGAAGNLPRPAGMCYLIGRLDHALKRRLRDVLAPIGLTVSQYTVLSLLDSQVQLSNAQLAERSFTSPQAANEMVKAMEGKGWIAREADQNHGRIVHLRLTADGKEILLRADGAVARLESAMLSKLGNLERTHLQQHLRELLHTLSAIMVDPAFAE